MSNERNQRATDGRHVGTCAVLAARRPLRRGCQTRRARSVTVGTAAGAACTISPDGCVASWTSSSAAALRCAPGAQHVIYRLHCNLDCSVMETMETGDRVWYLFYNLRVDRYTQSLGSNHRHADTSRLHNLMPGSSVDKFLRKLIYDHFVVVVVTCGDVSLSLCPHTHTYGLRACTFAFEHVR